jgi:biopolymer transport protein ExbB
MNMLRLVVSITSIAALMAVSVTSPGLAQQAPATTAPAPAAASPVSPPADAQAPAPSASSQPAAPAGDVKEQAAPAAAASQAPPPAETQAPSTSSQPAAPAGEAKELAASGDKAPKSTTGGLHELSPWSMFLSADVLVKGVMIALAFASLITWTILVSKTIELWLARRRLQASLDRISGSKSLAEAQLALGSGDSLTGELLAVAVRESRMSEGTFNDSGIKERAQSSFAELSRAEGRRVRFGMGVLATIGAISPFVGLFGTVWGIMNSFIGISKSQTTNLAVVAPGIAEALLATAIGLVAAIPAVIIYNHFSRVTKNYMELASRATGAAGRLLSRDLDRNYCSSQARAAE